MVRSTTPRRTWIPTDELAEEDETFSPSEIIQPDFLSCRPVSNCSVQVILGNPETRAVIQEMCIAWVVASAVWISVVLWQRNASGKVLCAMRYRLFEARRQSHKDRASPLVHEGRRPVEELRGYSKRIAITWTHSCHTSSVSNSDTVP